MARAHQINQFALYRYLCHSCWIRSEFFINVAKEKNFVMLNLNGLNCDCQVSSERCSRVEYGVILLQEETVLLCRCGETSWCNLFTHNLKCREDGNDDLIASLIRVA